MNDVNDDIAHLKAMVESTRRQRDIYANTAASLDAALLVANGKIRALEEQLSAKAKPSAKVPIDPVKR